MAHAFLSPSGAPAWMRCNAKPFREEGLPDNGSDASNEGTAAHFLLEQCLIQGVDADKFTGCSIAVGDTVEFHTSGKWPVGPEMTREIQKVLDLARSDAEGATIYSEQVLPISQFTGEEGATGTCDMIVVRGRTLRVRDLKYGRGVQVFAEGNEQLLIYGGAALDEFDLLGEVETLELCIDQPRLNHYDMWTISVADAKVLLEKIRQTADLILTTEPETLAAEPGDKQCKFCKAKATCEEYRDFVLGAIVDDFVDLDKGAVEVSIDQAEKLLANAFGVTPKAIDFQPDMHPDFGHEKEVAAHFIVKKPNIRPSLEAAELALPEASDERLATLMDAADMIEGFAKAVRAETERRLLLGKFSDPRYKLVQGKRGNRVWFNPQDAEAQMKCMRLKVDQMYDFKLISPPAAEALLKASNPRKWAKLEKLIGQTDGAPSVAPASDKRPALSIAVADSFDVIEDETPVVEDTFDDLI